MGPERVNTVVIGAGQAGLSVGYHLQKRKLPFVILDKGNRVGDSWRNRWDSLRLFTPARFNGIDGMPFPSDSWYFPTKNEMADYLEAYSGRFGLPVQTGVSVERVRRENGDFLVAADGHTYRAANVVVAMASYQQSKIPSFAGRLDPSIRQLHSLDYKNPSQLIAGGVLVVGAGNSGAEIAVEVAKTHKTWMAGRDVGHVPFRIEGLPARLILARLVLRGLFHRLLTTSTPLGRKARPKVLAQGGPLIRQKPSDFAAAGIERVPRVSDVRDGFPVLEDGRVLRVSNVIWCTGFDPGFSWLDLPNRGAHEPEHRRGVSREPGLYFVGLHFLHAVSSSMVHGVGRDAEFVAHAIANGGRA